MNSRQKEYVNTLKTKINEIKKTIDEVTASAGADYEYGYYSYDSDRKKLYLVITDNEFNFPTESTRKPIEFYLPKAFKLKVNIEKCQYVYDGMMFECEIL